VYLLSPDILGTTQQHRHFAPFVVSTDGMLGKEVRTFNKRTGDKSPVKWQKAYSQACGFVYTRDCHNPSSTFLPARKPHPSTQDMYTLSSMGRWSRTCTLSMVDKNTH